MRILSALTAVSLCVGCSDTNHLNPGPTSPSSVPAVPSNVVATYSATFTASPSCAPSVSTNVMARSYSATLLTDGRIQWSAPTMHPPPGHSTVSNGSMSGDRFSFSLGLSHDIQSDAFNGIWDTLSASSSLTIEGKGDGMVQGTSITGAFDGPFVYYEGEQVTGCFAADHRFTFMKQ